jgi:protoporphyrinogen oxidase
MTDRDDRKVVIIGGGPAGLTAAYQLIKHNLRPLVLEERDRVGGISRTESYKGYHFDMGGHRFFTKAKPVKELWHEVMGSEFLLRPRLSRIYYQDKFFHYPLKPANALLGLGPVQAVLIGLSFVRWQLFPYKKEETYEQWVTNRFGQRLFRIFFKAYTEKVWGIPTSELKSEWAAQRIKDLSLKSALISMFVKPKDKITSLIEEFHYPRFGPGMLWTAVKDIVEHQGGEVRLQTEVVRLNRSGNCIDSVVVRSNGSGPQEIRGSDYISSMPISELVKRMHPVPDEVRQAAEQLTYRDFLTVCLIVNQPDLFPDNWIYVHAPEVKVGRIQNFKNWSPDMVPDPSKTSLGLEYFCNEGDDLWNMPDADLVELGKREIERVGLARYADVEDGCVFRVPKAYPVYDADYREYLAVVRQFVDGLENLQTIGRNGLHRYNNQDHAMMTGMLAVRNLVFDEHNDLWTVNTDQTYHEEVRAGEADKTPDVASAVRGSLRRMFPRLDPVAFGAAVGAVAGLTLFAATLFLVLRGGAVVGPNLQLLNNFFPGYTVTPVGSLVGLAYASIAGFGLGWIFAYLRNVAVYLSAVAIHRDIELHLLRRLLDYM